MRKISWLLGLAGGAALVSVAAVQGVAASTAPGPATVLKFDTMTPVTGPYVGPANPVRGYQAAGYLGCSQPGPAPLSATVTSW